MTIAGNEIIGERLDDHYWVDQAQQLLARLSWGEILDPAETRQLAHRSDYARIPEHPRS